MTWKRAAHISSLCVFALVCALSAPLSAGAEPADVAPALSRFTETAEGRVQYIDALERRFKRDALVKTGSDVERMRRILSDLSARLSLDFEPTLLLLDAKRWNAYALPGDIIIVTTSLASDLDDTELRALLLHELGHIALGHPRAALNRSAGARKSLKKSTALLAAGRGQAAADAFVSAVYKGRVERADEIAADVWAAERLHAAGLTVHETIAYLRHAQRKLGDPVNSTLHPTFDERIELFQK